MRRKAKSGNEQRKCAVCGSPLWENHHGLHCLACLLDASTDGYAGADNPAGTQSVGAARCFGKYQLKRQIGRGGMGVVYEAWHDGLHRTVALKMILDSQIASPVVLRRFEIEAEAAAKLDHPNIVPLYDVGEVDGQPFFTMKLVKGESLRDRIKHGQCGVGGNPQALSRAEMRARLRTAAQLLTTIARAVQHAHETGVVHRDLKPSNIIITPAGEPHLTDFGLAKILELSSEDPSQPTLTHSTIAGSVHYMSPEQAAGLKTGAGCDIFSLGVILYELITGALPFTGHSNFEIIRKVIEEEPVRPRAIHKRIDRDLDTICMKCLEKKSALRYATAGALADDLQRWLADQPITARPAGPLRRVHRWMNRNRLGAAVIVILTLGSISGVLFQQMRRHAEELDLMRAERIDKLMEEADAFRGDPKQQSMEIPSSSLAIVDRRRPKPPGVGVHELTLSLLGGEPPGAIKQYAQLFGILEKKMSRALGASVRLNLRFVKSAASSHAQGDFLALSPIEWRDTPAIFTNFVPVIRAIAEQDGLIFTRTTSHITNLPGIAGHSVAFPNSKLPLTVEAKALLVTMGLRAADLSRYTNMSGALSFDDVKILSRRGGERMALVEVLMGKYEVGVSSRSEYNKVQHSGLVELAPVPSPGGIYAARRRLGTNVIHAFVQAMTTLPAQTPGMLSPVGFEKVDHSFVERFEQQYLRSEEFGQ